MNRRDFLKVTSAAPIAMASPETLLQGGVGGISVTSRAMAEIGAVGAAGTIEPRLVAYTALQRMAIDFETRAEADYWARRDWKNLWTRYRKARRRNRIKEMGCRELWAVYKPTFLDDSPPPAWVHQLLGERRPSRGCSWYVEQALKKAGLFQHHPHHPWLTGFVKVDSYKRERP